MENKNVICRMETNARGEDSTPIRLAPFQSLRPPQEKAPNASGCPPYYRLFFLRSITRLLMLGFSLL
jgi:hypothetical protein